MQFFAKDSVFAGLLYKQKNGSDLKGVDTGSLSAPSGDSSKHSATAVNDDNNDKNDGEDDDNDDGDQWGHSGDREKKFRYVLNF